MMAGHRWDIPMSVEELEMPPLRFHRWERFLGIVDEQFIHFLVADERQLAGQGIDVHLGSDSGTSCPEGCIHLGVVRSMASMVLART